jgi:methyl-accepting chemotaxis protein
MSLSISKKVGLIIIGSLFTTISIMLLIMLTADGSSKKDAAIQELHNLSQTMIKSVSFVMASGLTDVNPYIEKVKDTDNLLELRITPTDKIRNGSEAKLDEVEKSVLKSKKETNIEETFKDHPALRNVEAILSQESCNTCHGTNTGEPLAVVSIRYSLDRMHANLLSQVIIAVILGLVTIFSTYLFAMHFVKKKIIKPINVVVERMENLSGMCISNLAMGCEQLAVGDLNIKIETGTKQLEIESEDEIGRLAQHMNQIITDTEGIVSSVEKAIVVVKNTVNETKKLSEAAVNGNLSIRGNESNFEGSYKELIFGMNATFEAIIRPLNEASSVLETMAGGDLTRRISASYPGDYRKLKHSINDFGDSICNALNKVSEAVEATASASNEISSSTEQMAAGSKDQSHQTSQVAKTIMESTINVERASETAKTSGTMAREGGNVVGDTINGMNSIAKVVTQAAGMVKELGSSSDKIGEIILVINDIADQTNLLALNAAIEAARAGEQGRGFAVVADEVRKLAERTTKATKEISVMIKQIQTDTVNAVDSMEKGTEEVNNGKQLAQKAEEALHKIISSSQEVVENITLVAAASEEQSSTAEEISKNIESISIVTQESASGTHQIARTAEDLTRLTENLQNLVAQFKIDKQIDEHGSGKMLKPFEKKINNQNYILQ